MGNSRNTGYLQNAIKVSDTGAITFVSGSTTLMSISNTGAVSSSATTVSSSVDNLVVNNNAVLGSSESSTVSIPAFISSDLYPIADTYKLGSPANYWTRAYVQTGSFNEVNITGKITAQTLVVQTITSSVDFVTGSTRFGSILSNTHVFSGSVTMNPGGLFVSSSGLVGIGTTTPTKKLSVANDMVVGAQGGSDVTIITGGSGFGSIIQNIYATGGVNNEIRGNGDNYFNAILGNVGIGTSSTLNKLSVRGNVDFGATGLAYAGPSQYGGVMFPRGQILFSNTNSQNQFYISSNAYTNASGVFAYRNSSQPATAIGLDNGGMAFLVAGNGTADATISWTSALGITNSGNVLIGDTSNASGAPTFYVKNKAGAVANIAGWNFGGTTTAENGNNCLLTVGAYYNGSALVATQTTATNYQQYSGTHVWYTNSGLTAGNTFSNTERMRINSGGGVRIGSTTAFNDDIRFNVYGTGVWAGANIGLQNGGTGGKDWVIFSTNNEFGQGGGNFLIYNNSGPTANGLIIYANGNYDFGGSDVSDIRLKQDIENLNHGLNDIMLLSPKSYYLKSEDNLQEENQTILRKRYGFIAQEVQQVLPDTITGEETETDYLGLDYNGVLAVAVKAIQELKAENDTLKEILQRNNIQ